MKLEKSLAAISNAEGKPLEEKSLENYKLLVESLKRIGKYKSWVKKCRVHYRKKFVDGIKNYFKENEFYPVLELYFMG